MTELQPTGRRYGPAVGEPPPPVDPRRWGSLIGVVGGLVFIGSYSLALGTAASVSAWTVGILLALAAVFAHYVRPVALGPLTRPSPVALAIYGACVVGELVLIKLGTRLLTSSGNGDLRPALIAAVVGLHFLPFAWAFNESMFFWLGGLVLALGAAGLTGGAAGVTHAAEAGAVLAGLALLIVITLYARGRFAPRPRAAAPS